MKIKQQNTKLINKISKENNVDELTAKILVNRGLTEQQKIYKFFNNNIFDLLNPYIFNDMYKAVDLILNTIKSNKKILIFGDRDTDGITSTALLYRVLKSFGGDIDFTIPEEDEDYGFNKRSVDYALDNNIDLIITVDCGTSDFSAIDYAKKNNINVIVTDHHEPSELKPDVFAIINPKIEDERYEEKMLAGVGVAFKLCSALILWKNKDFMQDKLFIHFEPKPKGKEKVLYLIFTEKCKIIKKNKYIVIDDKIEPVNLKEIQEVTEKFDECICLTEQDLDDFSKISPVKNSVSLEYYINKINENFIREISFRLDNCIAESLEIIEFENVLFDIFAFINEDYYLFLRKYLGLTAVGTIGDIVPLLGENRVIVKNGLKMLEYNNITCLKKLMEKVGLFKNVTSENIAFKIVPVMNSARRMKQAYKGLELLIEDDDYRIEEIIEELLQLNSLRKKKNRRVL